MKTLTVTVASLALVGVLAASFGAETPEPTRDVAMPRALREVEAERALVATLDRADTGALSVEALNRDREPVLTRSTNFVVEGITTSQVKLPVAGSSARIGIFSATDGSLDARLTAPGGAEVGLRAHARGDNSEVNAFSKVEPGRGAEHDGVLLMSSSEFTVPGTYTLDILRSASPVDIIVNDAGGPELVVWLPESGFDRNKPVEIRARLMDGSESVTGAMLTVSRRGEPRRSWQFAEIEPGLYGATVRASGERGLQQFVVAATGKTANGFEVVRHASVGTISGTASAEVIGVGAVRWTDSDLEVDLRVKVTAPGRFHARANLVSDAGEPIAWAQDARELTTGVSVLTLHFARELVDPQARGGLVLTDAVLMNVTEAPGVKAISRLPSALPVH